MTQKIAAKEKGDGLATPGNSRPTPMMRERLEGIEQMFKRLVECMEFMRQVDSLKGSSEEAKENAVAAFHERMKVLERQLGRICDDLRLG